MPYSSFTLKQVQQNFGCQLVKGKFVGPALPIAPSAMLETFLSSGIPLAIDTGSEKARSEFIVAPMLMEVRNLLGQQISLFSGEDFTVDASRGLNGICDFLISKSASQLVIEAPVIVIVEAKKGELNAGWGQCIAEMLAAQQFNESAQSSISTIYGTVTSGTIWQFIQLQGTLVTIDTTEYTLPPVDQVLGILKWMAEN